MLRIAVVEDEKEQSDLLLKYINDYQKEKFGEKSNYFHVETFADGLDFLERDKSFRFNLVFMDIKMSYLNGMAVAQKMRTYNTSACLIFVTNMVSYAIKGYDVSAIAFMVKPVSYSEFCFKMDKAIEVCGNNEKTEITVKQGKNTVILNTDEIIYLESVKHAIVYKNLKPENDITVWNVSMRDEEQRLAPYGFARCNSGMLVNLNFVSKINGNEIVVGNEVLPLGRSKKKAFTETFFKWVAGRM